MDDMVMEMVKDMIEDVGDIKDPRAKKVLEAFHLEIDKIPRYAGNLGNDIENYKPGMEDTIRKDLAARSFINYELTKRVEFSIKEADGNEIAFPRMNTPREHGHYATKFFKAAKDLKRDLPYR